MKCPLLVFDHYTSFEKISSEVTDCLKEECALWDKTSQTCVLLTIGDNSGGVQYFLKEILARMIAWEAYYFMSLHPDWTKEQAIEEALK